jgi:hypothetical protein
MTPEKKAEIVKAELTAALDAYRFIMTPEQIALAEESSKLIPPLVYTRAPNGERITPDVSGAPDLEAMLEKAGADRIFRDNDTDRFLAEELFTIRGSMPRARLKDSEQ